MAGSKGDTLDEFLVGVIHESKHHELSEKWINQDKRLQQETIDLFPEECSNHHIFDPSTKDHPKTCITIRSIKDTPYDCEVDESPVSLYAGGPGSMIGAALDSTLSSNVMYVTYDFKHSNARSSAYYFHIRHSNALGADSLVRGPNILYQFFRRRLLSNRQLEAECRQLGFLKVDLPMQAIFSSPAHCFRTLHILAGGLYHTYRNVMINTVSPLKTEWAHNRSYSKNSVCVLRYLEAFGKKIGVRRPALLVGTEQDPESSQAIHVVFDKQGARHTEQENAAILKTNDIRSRELSTAEIAKAIDSENHSIYKAYVYPEDGRIPADMNITLSEIVKRTGNKWQEGVAVDSVYIDESGVRGVLLKDVQTGQKRYQPCSSVVLSLGYSARYVFEKPRNTTTNSVWASLRSVVSTVKVRYGLSHPVPNTTVATGCSGYFLVKGKIPIIGAQNSHWTEVAYSPEKDITLAKLTGGGNIGSEYIPATYALNNLEHIRALFRERLIDVLSIDSCPRAINPKNDIQFYRLAPGFVISLGLGGTGMTKGGANGALSYLLTHSKVQTSDLIPGSNNLFANTDISQLLNERSTHTLKALNLDHSFSLPEIFSLCTAGFGLGYMVRHFAVRTRSAQRVSKTSYRSCFSCNLRLLNLLQKSLRRIRL